MSDLLTAIEGPIARCVFNRPERRNALSDDMVASMLAFFAAIERDSSVRCLVISGQGEHFMAGGDVKDFVARLAVPPEERRTQFEARVHLVHLALLRLARLPKPVLASVKGAAAGFGLSLALACDLVIAADSAFFSLAYINIGTSPDGGSTYFLPRIVGLRRAKELAFLGDRIEAKLALELGLVNFLVPAAELPEATEKLAHRLGAGPPRALANTKGLLNQSFDQSFESQLSLEARSFADCAASGDMVEGVAAFVEKRAPRFQGQ